MVGTAYDPEFEIKRDMISCKHVDDVSMSGIEKQIDLYQSKVESVFGTCKMNKHEFTCCAVKFKKLGNGDVTLDQDDYIKQLRPIVSEELTGKDPNQKATQTVSDLFVSLRGALAYCLLTQFWIQVYVVALQRIQQPTNLDVRRLNAITRKLQREPKKITYLYMQCSRELDLHTDSGYRRITEAEDVKGYGMRGLCLLRRGVGRGNAPVIHFIESICKSHRLAVRSSYGAELLASSHGFDDAFPTIVTVCELHYGACSPRDLKNFREQGGLKVRVTLTTDAESVFRSLSSRDCKTPAEKTLLGHVMYLRELLMLGLVDELRWCDTRDMTADGHTKGCIDRALLLKLMAGIQTFVHPLKKHLPFRKNENGSVRKRPSDEEANVSFMSAWLSL